jgi:hypothetical protein
LLKKERTIDKLTRQTIGGQSTLLKFLQNVLNEDPEDIRHIELTYFSLSVTTFFYLQFGSEEDKKELLDEVNHLVFSKSIPASQEDLRLEQAQNEYELRLEEYSNPDDHRPDGDRLEEVEAAVAEVFARRPREAWLEYFDPAEVPVAPVNELDEVWEDPQVIERDLLRYLEIDGEDVPLVDNPIDTREERDWIREPHPGLGEHTRELLTERGLSDAEIEQMAADGVIDEP